jgi:hypothetical protein
LLSIHWFSQGKFMKGDYMETTKCLVVSLLFAALASAADATIAPYVVTTTSGGAWTYGGKVSSGQVNFGDGFTIFDFGGYVNASIFAPAGWTPTVQLSGSVLNVAPPVGYVDDPSLFNLLFTRTGTTVGPTNGVIDLGLFGATTTFTSTTLVGWSSRDHTPEIPGHPSMVAQPHADSILAPSVPDSGPTVALLGIGLAGIEAIRRVLRSAQS